MEVTINGNITIGTKVDVAAGATYIHTRIDKVDTYNYSEAPEASDNESASLQLTRSMSKLDMQTGLSSYFTMGFKGRNPLKTDYLPILVDDIMAFQTPKDQARIANMLYNSREMINKPKSFSQWYKEFCRICGLNRKKYDQNKVDDYDFLKKRFYYLTF